MKDPNVEGETTRIGQLRDLPTEEPRSGDPQPLWMFVQDQGTMHARYLATGSDVVIGRGPAVDIRVKDVAVSRRHIRLFREGDEVWLEDLMSSNGTRLNGQPVHELKKLSPRDRVSMGHVQVWIHSVAPPTGELAQAIVEHEMFLDETRMELERTRAFGRPLALVMLSTNDPQRLTFELVPRIQGVLRNVDRLGAYSDKIVEVRLPESGRPDVDSVTTRIRRVAEDLKMELRVGVALFPYNATSVEELVETALVALRSADPKVPTRIASSTMSEVFEEQQPIIQNARMSALFEEASQIAGSAVPVLIRGETGAGKEVLARHVHKKSRRANGPLINVNCAAIAPTLIESTLFGYEKGAFTGAQQQKKGVFDAAHSGTLFLDEIGELSPLAQAALLRVIEAGAFTRVGGTAEVPVDVRLITATHRHLEEMAHAGTFRWDLFYRLGAVILEIPPLRERPEEIPALVNRFLRESAKTNHSRAVHMSPEALEILAAYDWPGNVRELRNVVFHAAIHAKGTVVLPDELSPRVLHAHASDWATGEFSILPESVDGSSTAFRDRVSAFEKQLMLEALQSTAWNKTKAAQRLRMPLRTLTAKLKALGIKQPG